MYEDERDATGAPHLLRGKFRSKNRRIWGARVGAKLKFVDTMVFFWLANRRSLFELAECALPKDE